MDSVEELAAAAGIELRTGPGYDWDAFPLKLPTDYKRVVDGFPRGEFKKLVRVAAPAIRRPA